MARLQRLAPSLRPADQRAAKPPPKEADSVYGTPEHKAWAAGVIKRAGGICALCRKPKRLLADHIKEIRDGGEPLDPKNGQALCWSCNTAKGAEARAARQRA